MSRTQTVLSRRQIEGLIADGRSIFIVDQKVIKADAWLKYHPGGDKAILHMVGRDATDEIYAYVNPARHGDMMGFTIFQASLPRGTKSDAEILYRSN